MEQKTEIACKWATCGFLFSVFFGLVSLAGCINVVEFFGSIMAAVMAARLFYSAIRRVPLKLREIQHNSRFA